MKWLLKHTELIGWCIALLCPFFIDPAIQDHFSFCLFHQLGITWCPGCGLGRSMAYLYQGELQLSWQTHWLAIPTLLILIARIVQLLFYSKNNNKPTYYGSKNAYDASGYTTR
ncbi:MAG: DUF2752 domain-containing protein [Chitinophagaceae bacterium]|nr:DUF2752 domain-containing protein [Chitinophagaceae bacterium]